MARAFHQRDHPHGGSGPGTFSQDGWLSLFTMRNAGMPFYDSIEIDQLHHPIRIETRRLVLDSEGAGTYRGAPGIVTEFRPVDSISRSASSAMAPSTRRWRRAADTRLSGRGNFCATTRARSRRSAPANRSLSARTS
jgi:N-methylhydantoinase B/oxoprolinase/acetone carboxylase alpha subunit